MCLHLDTTKLSQGLQADTMISCEIIKGMCLQTLGIFSQILCLENK